MIRIAIADDHGVVREGLKLLLNAQTDMKVIAEFDNAVEVAASLTGVLCDVAILDWSMPGGGLEAVREIRAAGLATRLVMLTMHSRPVYARTALEAGADGFVLKSAEGESLLDAVRAVAGGGSYVDKKINQEDDGEVLLVPNAPLSPRELEVLRSIAEGHTNQETADGLGLSVKTVEGYRARVSQKLAATGRADLVRYALQIGLLE